MRALFALNVLADVFALTLLLIAGWYDEGWQFWLALFFSVVMQLRMTTGLWLRAYLKER